MEEVCSTCGDVGWDDFLLTCIQCKISRMHTYCFGIPLDEPIDDWCCEECESRSVTKAPSSNQIRELSGVSKANCDEVCGGSKLPTGNCKLPNESRKGPFCSKNRVERRKTKYIPIKDAIELSSRTINSKRRPEVGIRVSEQTSNKPTSVPLSCSPQKDLASGSLQHPRTQQYVSGRSSKEQPQQFRKPKVLRSVHDIRSPKVPMEKNTQQEQLANIQLCHVEQKSSMEKSSLTLSQKVSSVNFSDGGGHSPIEQRNHNAMDSSNYNLPDVNTCSRTPALDALWKGRFSIAGEEHNCGELNYYFQAHPPCHVHRKIFEFSKQMPEILHFQLVPFEKFWINFFGEHVPNEQDIGLYFFPNNSERSIDYIFLVGFIGLKKLALRKQIADVELLIFTSKLLPIDCQFWKGNYFLWGVFHNMKRAHPANRGPKLSVQPWGYFTKAVVPSPDVKTNHNNIIPPGFEEEEEEDDDDDLDNPHPFPINKKS